MILDVWNEIDVWNNHNYQNNIVPSTYLISHQVEDYNIKFSHIHDFQYHHNHNYHHYILESTWWWWCVLQLWIISQLSISKLYHHMYFTKIIHHIHTKYSLIIYSCIIILSANISIIWRNKNMKELKYLHHMHVSYFIWSLFIGILGK